mmetsp:Transcript_17461/g.30089  ORF Transcript_17461/g.30089 Transcript_17461/m.30089 type:complete len:625 (+) Transcript_17461:448-2322(+)
MRPPPGAAHRKRSTRRSAAYRASQAAPWPSHWRCHRAAIPKLAIAAPSKSRRDKVDPVHPGGAGSSGGFCQEGKGLGVNKGIRTRTGNGCAWLGRACDAAHTLHPAHPREDANGSPGFFCKNRMWVRRGRPRQVHASEAVFLFVHCGLWYAEMLWAAAPSLGTVICLGGRRGALLLVALLVPQGRAQTEGTDAAHDEGLEERVPPELLDQNGERVPRNAGSDVGDPAEEASGRRRGVLVGELDAGETDEHLGSVEEEADHGDREEVEPAVAGGHGPEREDGGGDADEERANDWDAVAAEDLVGGPAGEQRARQAANLSAADAEGSLGGAGHALGVHEVHVAPVGHPAANEVDEEVGDGEEPDVRVEQHVLHEVVLLLRALHGLGLASLGLGVSVDGSGLVVQSRLLLGHVLLHGRQAHVRWVRTESPRRRDTKRDSCYAGENHAAPPAHGCGSGTGDQGGREAADVVAGVPQAPPCSALLLAEPRRQHLRASRAPHRRDQARQAPDQAQVCYVRAQRERHVEEAGEDEASCEEIVGFDFVGDDAGDELAASVERREDRRDDTNLLQREASFRSHDRSRICEAAAGDVRPGVPKKKCQEDSVSPKSVLLCESVGLCRRFWRKILS